MDNAYYGLVCVNPAKHNNMEGQIDMMNNCTERPLLAFLPPNRAIRYNPFDVSQSLSTEE